MSEQSASQWAEEKMKDPEFLAQIDLAMEQRREIEALAVDRGIMAPGEEWPDALSIAWLLGGYEKTVLAVDFVANNQERRRKRPA